jgi:murein DD-endopeptidase MepM/ murein hydrolase activator NlpD
VSEDPLGILEGPNAYAYASNNPITFLDLLGLSTWPGRGGIASPFGARGGGFHNGVDVRNPNGSPVVASDSGVVVPVGQGGPGGNQVGIRHDGGSMSIYSHTSPTVKPGDRVSEGQPIGCTDRSGRQRGGGNHVHYIYFPQGSRTPADPAGHLPPTNNYPKYPPPNSCAGGSR